MTITTEMLTRNIAKSGEVPNLGGVSPFGHHLGLIVNRSQSASCYIATVSGHCKMTLTQNVMN